MAINRKEKRAIKRATAAVDRARKDGVDDVITPSQDALLINNREMETAVIGEKEILEATATLLKYKEGKINLENKIIENEQWFKQRYWDYINRDTDSKKHKFEPKSAWLFNCLMSKYADYMDAFPEANILPREENDKQEAEILSSIIPVVLEQNGFQKVYSNEAWKKLKDGAGIYGCFWDGQKFNGLGDISIKNIDFLNLFWEPGITDIQDSSNVFHVNLVPNKILKSIYPEIENFGETITKAKYIYDESIDTSDKSLVVDWYYKKHNGDREVLHFVKFCGTTVLYASENDTERPSKQVEVEKIVPETGQKYTIVETQYGESVAEIGWYEHGMYPFVVDVMFPVEGSICGISMLDLCKEPQKYIDLLDQAVLLNALMNAKPRYFNRNNGVINEEEFTDWTKDIVHVEGDLSDLNLRKIEPPEMNGSAMTKINDKINEMKETTGNTDVARGNIAGGVTSGSAISALQESAGKTSRSQNKMAYQAYSELVTMVIELIRQFYDNPRQFRITGKEGYEFKSYSNKNIKEQPIAGDFGVEDGLRLPLFDVEVVAQKQNPYSKNSQNELALQLYSAGFFAPQNADVALACLDVMDFKHKNDVINKIQGNSMLLNENNQLKQMVVQLLSQVDPQVAAQYNQAFMQEQGPGVGENVQDINLSEDSEHPFNKKSREQAAAATQVN